MHVRGGQRDHQQRACPFVSVCEMGPRRPRGRRIGVERVFSRADADCSTNAATQSRIGSIRGGGGSGDGSAFSNRRSVELLPSAECEHQPHCAQEHLVHVRRARQADASAGAVENRAAVSWRWKGSSAPVSTSRRQVSRPSWRRRRSVRTPSVPESTDRSAGSRPGGRRGGRRFRSQCSIPLTTFREVFAALGATGALCRGRARGAPSTPDR